MPETNNNTPVEEVGETWHFRGYNMRPGEFNTAMVHFYRGEISRSNTWRARLDSTTNWAVVSTAALLTFAFGTTDHHHVVLLLGILLNTIFLYIEARRYRYYELWALRVRLMETDFFAAMLAPPFGPGPDWASQLTETLLSPQFPISEWEAIGRRLRRNYLGIFLLILFSWSIKLMIHPTSLQNYTQFVERASVGPAPGSLVILFLSAFYIFIISLAVFTTGLHNSPGEVLPRYNVLEFSGDVWSKIWPIKPRRHLVFIITEQGKAVSDQILQLLHRGVTGLQGTGMYTGSQRMVLLCAVKASEIAYLKSLVYTTDPQAFIVVNPAHDIIGHNFSPLKQTN